MADTSNPVSGIPLIGPVIDLLNNILSNAARVEDLARSVDAVEQNTWGNLINLAGYTYGMFDSTLSSLGGLIKGIGKALEDLITDKIWGYIKRLFDAIKKWIENLRNWIKVHVAILQQIQRNLDKARSQYFRKIIDIVQRIRKILVPFRLLHLKFAKDLDAKLVGFESDIGKKWAAMIQHQNAVLGVLNDIIDPRQLLRPGHALGSVGLMIGAIYGAVGAADIRKLFCLAPETTAQPFVLPWVVTQANLLSDINGNTGDYAIFVAQRDQALQQYAFDLGLPTL